MSDLSMILPKIKRFATINTYWSSCGGRKSWKNRQQSLPKKPNIFAMQQKRIFTSWIVKYCSFVAMWNEIRLFTFAKQIFHSVAISHGEAIFHSPKANFTKKKPSAFANDFFLVTPFQNWSVPQVFSKSIRVSKSADRLIPWQWWVPKVVQGLSGFAPCL